MVVLVVFPLLARPAPVSTKYHTIAGILDATVTLCRQPLPGARPQPFLSALPFTRRASKLRREQPLHAPMLISTQVVLPPVGPSRFSSRSLLACPKSSSVPTVFAASPAPRRWTTPPCTPLAARSALISSKPVPRRTCSSAWTPFNPARTSLPFSLPAFTPPPLPSSSPASLPPPASPPWSPKKVFKPTP